MDWTIPTLILTALLPVIVTVAIGYFSGMHHDFAWDQAGTLTKAVMLYALPLNLFSGMVVTPRATIMSQGPLAIVLIVALVLSFVIPLLVARYIFRRDLAISTLQALAIGSPAVPFIGVSVLAVLFGPISTTLIAVSGLPQNLFQLPLTLVLMSIATGAAGPKSSLGAHVLQALKQPVVWAPVLAILLVFAGAEIPAPLDKSFALLGQATGGLALFAAGIVLFSRQIKMSTATIVSVVARNLIIPGITWLVLWGIHFPVEQLRQIVLTMAIPTGPIVIIIAMQFKRGEQEMASTMSLSMISSIITMGGFIWLTN
jgi:malonate transporter and related proteins